MHIFNGSNLPGGASSTIRSLHFLHPFNYHICRSYLPNRGCSEPLQHLRKKQSWTLVRLPDAFLTVWQTATANRKRNMSVACLACLFGREPPRILFSDPLPQVGVRSSFQTLTWPCKQTMIAHTPVLLSSYSARIPPSSVLVLPNPHRYPRRLAASRGLILGPTSYTRSDDVKVGPTRRSYVAGGSSKPRIYGLIAHLTDLHGFI